MKNVQSEKDKTESEVEQQASTHVSQQPTSSYPQAANTNTEPEQKGRNFQQHMYDSPSTPTGPNVNHSMNRKNQNFLFLIQQIHGTSAMFQPKQTFLAISHNQIFHINNILCN